MVDRGETAIFPSSVNLNPVLDVMKIYQEKDEYLSSQVREKTNAIQNDSKDIKSLNEFISKLRDEYGIGINANGKKITELDFSNSPEIKALIDNLSEKGLLDEKYKNKYTYHSAIEIEMFIAYLEGKVEQKKNDKEPALLMIHPLLDMIKQLADIVKKINESNEKLLEKTNRL